MLTPNRPSSTLAATLSPTLKRCQVPMLPSSSSRPTWIFSRVSVPSQGPPGMMAVSPKHMASAISMLSLKPSSSCEPPLLRLLSNKRRRSSSSRRSQTRKARRRSRPSSFSFVIFYYLLQSNCTTSYISSTYFLSRFFSLSVASNVCNHLLFLNHYLSLSRLSLCVNV